MVWFKHHEELRTIHKFFIGVALVLIGLLITMAVLQKFAYRALIDGSKYQTVLLQNGQQYFGKLDVIDEHTLRLRDVYYLQLQNDLPSDPASSNGQTNLTQTSNLDKATLVKLTDQPLIPAGEIVLSRNNVVLWENVDDKSQVIQAIKTRR